MPVILMVIYFGSAIIDSVDKIVYGIQGLSSCGVLIHSGLLCSIIMPLIPGDHHDAKRYLIVEILSPVVLVKAET